MAKQIRFYGDLRGGKFKGFPADAVAILAQALGDCECEVVFIKKQRPPTPGIRGFYHGHVVPWFMSIMHSEGVWELHPASYSDREIAKTRILQLFHRPGTVKQDTKPGSDKMLVNLPSHRDLDNDDYHYLVRRCKDFCEENFGAYLPDGQAGPNGPDFKAVY
jgi:hypothetical protein